MKGTLRSIPDGKKFGFIRSTTMMDNIFIHADNYYGDWRELTVAFTSLSTKNVPIRVKFELEQGARGIRAIKCERISEIEFQYDES